MPAQPELPLCPPFQAPQSVEPVTGADSEAREARRSALAPAPPPAKRTPAQPRSAQDGPGTALSDRPLSPPSQPIKTARSGSGGAKTPPSGGGSESPCVSVGESLNLPASPEAGSTARDFPRRQVGGINLDSAVLQLPAWNHGLEAQKRISALLGIGPLEETPAGGVRAGQSPMRALRSIQTPSGPSPEIPEKSPRLHGKGHSNALRPMPPEIAQTESPKAEATPASEKVERRQSVAKASGTSRRAVSGALTLPGLAPALARRLWPILKRAGYILPGDPAWRSPAELDRWFAAPRAELGGRAWADVHVPFTLEGRMRFAHAMDQIDRETVEVPA
jgi:hypothetical protein